MSQAFSHFFSVLLSYVGGVWLNGLGFCLPEGFLFKHQQHNATIGPRYIRHQKISEKQDQATIIFHTTRGQHGINAGVTEWIAPFSFCIT